MQAHWLPTLHVPNYILQLRCPACDSVGLVHGDQGLDCFIRLQRWSRSRHERNISVLLFAWRNILVAPRRQIQKAQTDFYDVHPNFNRHGSTGFSHVGASRKAVRLASRLLSSQSIEWHAVVICMGCQLWNSLQLVPEKGQRYTDWAMGVQPQCRRHNWIIALLGLYEGWERF
jgi:hypothetical protein